VPTSDHALSATVAVPPSVPARLPVPARVRLAAAIVPASVLCLAVLVAQLFAAPRFAEIFTDFGVDLPGLTLLALGNARWLGGGQPGQAYPMWPATVFALALLIGGSAAAGPQNHGSRMVLHGLSLLGLLGVIALVVAYAQPLVGLQAALKGP